MNRVHAFFIGVLIGVDLCVVLMAMLYVFGFSFLHGLCVLGLLLSLCSIIVFSKDFGEPELGN